MPDHFFFRKSKKTGHKEAVSSTGITAIINIQQLDEVFNRDEAESLNDFFHDLAIEFYNMRRQNYGLGLRAIEPQLSVCIDRITLHSPLFLEKSLPDLSSIIFKHFVDYCNLLLATALKNKIPVVGVANLGKNYDGKIYSGGTKRAPSKESLVLSDLLEVFTFDEIFPDGFGQKIISPVEIPYFYGNDLNITLKLLSEMEEIGIFMPAGIGDNTISELSILSDMLLETTVNGQKMYSCNWKTIAEKDSDTFFLDKILEQTEKLAEGESEYSTLWKKFLDRTLLRT